MGDFEFALVFYHRGRRLRPDLPKFQLGINKAEEAIVNCIGSKKCHFLAPMSPDNAVQGTADGKSALKVTQEPHTRASLLLGPCYFWQINPEAPGSTTKKQPFSFFLSFFLSPMNTCLYTVSDPFSSVGES